ncbi:MAG: site-specific integrase [Acetobacterium sp.]|uniref:Tyrosine-type recombinase/integrase n=1 Tax=Acetobacterium malicum TaxID=52692 RepID=A0ABR6Z2F8_9FIRM|nr:tyrosine-type recombinase/integrase [Acetobacterium malicum]MBC3901692.1 tyrosine-type recombinase/integrase [Acetobacterium malicum]MBU4438681.1 site-specific integrase [Bacillota bacterium]MCG2731398.1 site-specific integrase [Acetobacterium sp.]
MMNSRFSHFVQKYFLSYMISQRNYGNNTVSSYRDTFRLFLKYLMDTGPTPSELDLQDITLDTVRLFVEWLARERNNSVSTRNVRLAHLKSFYEYVLSVAPEYSGLCSDIINLPFAKTESCPPTYMTEDEVFHLLKGIDAESKAGLRHLAILTLLYDSGCRVQEILDLNVSDIQLDKCSRIYVHGKGNKYRQIPLRPETVKIIKKYIQCYGLKPNDILFMNRQGCRLTRQGIRHIMQKYEELVHKEHPEDCTIGFHPHLLRHSKATHLVNAGVSIYNVRDFLGHSSVVTTQVYLTSNPEVTRKAIEQVSQKTIPQSADYYSEKEKAELMGFLDSLL